MKFIRNRKGFTLTELCIVLAIIAIVGVMVTSTVILTSKQNDDIQKEAAFIADVTDIQRRVNDWLNSYDNAGYDITDLEGQTILQAKSVSSVSTVTFSDNYLMIDGEEASSEYLNVSKVIFQVIKDTSSDGSGTIEGKVVQIRITAKKGDGTQTQTLLFPLFANKTRQRSVTGKNG